MASKAYFKIVCSFTAYFILTFNEATSVSFAFLKTINSLDDVVELSLYANS